MSSKNMRATAAAAVALGLAALAGGCGASNSSRNAGRVSITAQFLAYARCIRAHGVSDFPDPPPLRAAALRSPSRAVPAAI